MCWEGWFQQAEERDPSLYSCTLPWEWQWNWSIFYMREDWDIWDYVACRRETVRENLCIYTHISWTSVRKTELLSFSHVSINRTRGNRHKNCEGCLWTSGSIFSLWKWLRTGTGCPETLWIPHPWRYSKALVMILDNLITVTLLQQVGWTTQCPEFTEPRPFCEWAILF